MPSGLVSLLDDIAGITKLAAASLDDVGAAAGKAGGKAIGVVVDDTAVTPRYVIGLSPERELPIIGKIAMGSLRNKLLILLPAALVLSAFAPWAITPLLMLGGAYLCFEGCEKLLHKFMHSKASEEAHHQAHVQALADPSIDLATLERDKIKGAIRTDFILSAEIIVIALGTVAAADIPRQLLVLVGISLIMTVGVYGLVAGIVKLDDAGMHLSRHRGGVGHFGRAILFGAPWLMKGLSLAGTAAMFMVGGGIL